MSTKARLISTISAVCLILALLVTGVWAVSTANVTLGGTVTFTADNIHATITGSITGTQETVSITPLVYDADTVPSDEDKATWNNDVNFGTGNLITMKIHVKNNSTERSLFVKVTDNTTTSNIKKEFTSTVTDVGSGDTYEVIKGGEIEYTLTLSVDQLDLSASANYALDVDLRDENAPAEEEEETQVVTLDENKKAGGITYSLNDETSIATITAYDGSCNDNVVIPGQVSYDGKVYNLTIVSATADYASYFTNATKVTIKEGVTHIGDSAFYNCQNLTTIELPSSIEYISVSSTDCSNIESFNYMGTVKDWCEIDFDYDMGKALEKLRINGTPATEFTSITAEDLEGLTVIKEYPFRAFGNLSNLEIPSGVTTIAMCAFVGNETLATVTIPVSVTEIGSSSFELCTALTDIYYEGTQEQWDAININMGNDNLTSVTKHYNYGA